MSYVPKYIIKRIVPPDALANYDLNGDKKADHVGCKYVNVLSPMAIPPDIDPEFLLKQLKGIWLDGKKVEGIREGAVIFEGKKYSLNNIKEAAGKTIPVGGVLLILIPVPGGLPVGMHKLKLVTEYNGQESANEVEREITADRACLPAPKFS